MASASIARPLQGDFFGAQIVLPEELVYEEGFITPAEELALLAGIAALPLQEAPYKSYTARRRIASFGSEYDFDHQRLEPAPDLPAILLPLREKVASRSGVDAGDFSQAMVTQYRPGTPLGWHRDAPQYETVAGVSLGTACRMRFRRYPHEKHSKEKPRELMLEPRSVYVMKGESRWGWQHSVPPTPDLRYSITFRTLRRR